MKSTFILTKVVLITLILSQTVSGTTSGLRGSNAVEKYSVEKKNIDGSPSFAETPSAERKEQTVINVSFNLNLANIINFFKNIFNTLSSFFQSLFNISINLTIERVFALD